MNKKNLMRLKALLLTIIMCITFNSCGKENDEKDHDNNVIVIFIEGKALIYDGNYRKFIGEEYTKIGGSLLRSEYVARFSSGTDAVELKNMDDAVELATAIVGEENIVYIDYKKEDMQLSYKKKVKKK